MTGPQPTASGGDVDQLALRLMTAWEAVEGPVSASYVATFADMAREVLASDWLAEHDANVRREERERGSRRSDARPWRPEDGDGRCQDCGEGNVVWFTDNDLWNQVMPNEGVLCIPCFITRAEATGIKPTAWQLVREARGGAR